MSGVFASMMDVEKDLDTKAKERGRKKGASDDVAAGAGAAKPSGPPLQSSTETGVGAPVLSQVQQHDVASPPPAATATAAMMPPPPDAVIDMEADMISKQILSPVPTPAAAEPATQQQAAEAVISRKGVFWGKYSKNRSRSPLESLSPDISNDNNAASTSQDLLMVSAGRKVVPSQPGAFPVEGINATDNDNINTSEPGNRSRSRSSSFVEQPQPQQQQRREAVSTIWMEESNTLSATLVESMQFVVDEEEEDSFVDDDEEEGDQRRRITTTRLSSSHKLDLIDATPLPENGTRRSVVVSRTRIWVGLASCSVAAIILVVVVMLAFPPANMRSSTERPEADSEDSSVAVIYPPFRDGFITSTLKALQNPTSPAYKANAWMWQDPNLQSYSSERQLVRFALASLYYGKNGANWTRKNNWLDHGVHECDWFFNTETFGEACEEVVDDDDDNKPGEGVISSNHRRLVGIDLSNNNLEGTLAEEFFYFRHNQFIDFSFNRLYGTVPPLDEDSFTVKVIRISNNQMGGMLSVKAGHRVADGLREIDVSNNLFRGENLNVLALLTNLEVIRASGNHFSGSLDGARFGALANLTILDVADNQLTGALPSELGLLEHLTEVDFSANDFVGTIPVEWMQLPNLELLNVSDTLLTGVIPQHLCYSNPSLNIVANCSAIQCCF